MPMYEGFNVTSSDRSGKKYKAVDDEGNEIHFGASGYRIIPVLMQGILTALAAMAFHLREDRLIGGQGSCGVVRAEDQ